MSFYSSMLYNCIVKRRATKIFPSPGGPLFLIDSSILKHTTGIQIILFCWGAVRQWAVCWTVGLQDQTTLILHMSKMKKDPADNPQPSLVCISSLQEVHPFKCAEVVLQNGSLLKHLSDEDMNEQRIHKLVGEKLYYRVIYNSIEAINYILYYATNVIQRNNYYLPVKENKILFELLTIAQKKSGNQKTSKQRGYLWLERKDGKIDQYGPFFGNNKKHSEDFIVEQVLKIFNNFDDSSPISKHTDYTKVWIYSTYCPCLAKNNRELKLHNPCMINLYFLREKLENTYNIKTTIGFSEFYGLSGSFEKHLPYHPLKQNNFPMYQIKKRIKSDDSHSCELLKVYNTFVPEQENETFKMGKYVYKKSDKDMAETFSNLLKPIPKRLRQKVYEELHNLFQHPDLLCAFNEFIYFGWEKITNTREKLITMFENDLSDEVWKDYSMALEDIFLEWWDKKVKEASSIFINKILSDYLKMCTFQLFLNDIPDTVNKNFIGLLNHTIDHAHPVIKSENVIMH